MAEDTTTTTTVAEDTTTTDETATTTTTETPVVEETTTTTTEAPVEETTTTTTEVVPETTTTTTEAPVDTGEGKGANENAPENVAEETQVAEVGDGELTPEAAAAARDTVVAEPADSPVLGEGVPEDVIEAQDFNIAQGQADAIANS